MTALAGSSEVFWGGVVSYADEAKVILLGVPLEMIHQNGAVSSAVAQAMVAGLVQRSGVPLAVSVTGIAGPGGGSVDKPVGTVWFGLAGRRDGIERLTSIQLHFAGNRASIQRQTARWARTLACYWWDSGMELDSLPSLTDNGGKPFFKASLTNSPSFHNPL